MKTLSLSPFILFAFATALPACQGGDPASVGASYAAQVAPPAACGNGDPTCNSALDYPTQADLTTENSQNIEFAVGTNQIQLEPGSGLIIDTDGDGVPDPADECPGPGWRLPCDGDPGNDGVYQTLFFKTDQEATVQADLAITGSIQSADAYILMDATGSMGGEQVQLLKDLSSGTFVTGCAEAAGTGIVGALKCAIPDLWLGVGDFKEVSYLPHNNRYDMAPYHHYLDMTDDVQHIIDAVAQMVPDFNKDTPEAATQAMYAVVTGNGLGDLVPNRGACPSTPAGRWGYPCFRPGVLPIILLFSDAAMHNGPRLASPTYGNPPYDGTLGLGTRLPPVEQSPNVLYSSDPFTAWNLGDLSTKSLTVMGSNKNFGDDATTWDKGVCQRGSALSGYWGDGRDAFLRFSLSAGADMFVSGEGSAYHTTNVALFDLVDGALGYFDCNGGPGGGDYWGRLTGSLPPGDWYAVSDGAVDTSSSVADRLGNFQLRFHNLTADPLGYASWQTADLPIPWTTLETELLARNVNIVSVISPNSNGLSGLADATALGIATGSVDQSGNPYLQTINADGSGLSTALLDAVRALIGDTRRDISFVAEDNPATGAVDENEFVRNVTSSSCPTTGINNCLGGVGTSTCDDCLQGAEVAFQFRLGNTSVTETATAQVFDFDMVGFAGAAEIGRIPIRVMVPEAGGSYGSGFYQNTYDSDFVCEMPPERPDWGTLSWTGSTPSDSTVEFEIYTANTIEELDSVIPASIVYPTDTTAQSYDVGDELISAGHTNYMPFLRVRAKLNASSDSLSTPTFAGWSMEFNCIPFD